MIWIIYAASLVAMGMKLDPRPGVFFCLLNFGCVLWLLHEWESPKKRVKHDG